MLLWSEQIKDTTDFYILITCAFVSVMSLIVSGLCSNFLETGFEEYSPLKCYHNYSNKFLSFYQKETRSFSPKVHSILLPRK